MLIMWSCSSVTRTTGWSPSSMSASSREWRARGQSWCSSRRTGWSARSPASGTWRHSLTCLVLKCDEINKCKHLSKSVSLSQKLCGKLCIIMFGSFYNVHPPTLYNLRAVEDVIFIQLSHIESFSALKTFLLDLRFPGPNTLQFEESRTLKSSDPAKRFKDPKPFPNTFVLSFVTSISRFRPTHQVKRRGTLC